jgi:alkanesulfonate monooxygenase SsuD/methylene tetrahydromethanopterin reductase-like flavin-dependent oxidoreductase (luciferase family)
MLAGFALPVGPAFATADAIASIARAAESLGYDSIWAIDNDVVPVPVTGTTGVDGVRALAIAAEHTSRVTLGVSLANIPFQSPIAVAGSIAALDIVSGGRAEIGLGLGSTPEEFAYVAARLAQPKTPAGEFLRALATLWDCRANNFQGDHFVLAGTAVAACTAPVQRPRPRMSLVAFAPAAVQPPAVLLRRGAPVVSTRPSVAVLRELGAYVDHPGMPGLVIRAAVDLRADPLDARRSLFAGDRHQVSADLLHASATGARAVIVEIANAGQMSVEQLLAAMEAVHRLLPVDERVPVAA